MNITKTRFFVLLGVVLLLAIVVVGVYAYNAAGTGGVPNVIGHSVDEINWSQTIPAVIANQFCLGGSCITAWPSVGGTPGSSATQTTEITGEGVNLVSGIIYDYGAVRLDSFNDPTQSVNSLLVVGGKGYLSTHSESVYAYARYRNDGGWDTRVVIKDNSAGPGATSPDSGWVNAPIASAIYNSLITVHAYFVAPTSGHKMPLLRINAINSCLQLPYDISTGGNPTADFSNTASAPGSCPY